MTEDLIKKGANALGYPDARPLQREVLEQVMDGKDVLAILPTSAGKSLIYQIPAVVRPGPVVVCSPLVALMNDQVDRCRQQGLEAHTVHSHCSASERHRAQTAIDEGKAQILFLSPEKLQGIDRNWFGQHQPQLFAIDEAHCISEWGHDFRPIYGKIGRMLDRYWPDTQRIALTATAAPKVADHITQIVFGKGRTPHKIVRSPDRPNVRYAVAGARVTVVRMVQYVDMILNLPPDQNTPVLVYGGTRRSVEEAARELRASGFRAAHYHAGMERAERLKTEEAFRSGQVEVVCATCAFGMGIDHAQIRGVVHLEIPTSIEAFVQESGRAGRDGQQAISICRLTEETLDAALSMSLLTWPEPRRVAAFRRKLLELLHSDTPRWEGKGKLQATSEAIAHQVGMQPEEVGACLRILEHAGVIRRTPYADKVAKAVILPNAVVRLSAKRAQQLETLARHADPSGEIVGTIAFFLSIGLNRETLERLSAAGAIRYEWAERAQVIEIDNEAAVVDPSLLIEMRKRSIDRVGACRTFLHTPDCRRKFLLDYFESEAEQPPMGACCDRCSAKEASSKKDG